MSSGRQQGPVLKPSCLSKSCAPPPHPTVGTFSVFLLSKEGEAQKARTRGHLSHLPIPLKYPFPLKFIPTTPSRPGDPAGQYYRGFRLGLQLLVLKPFHWAAGAVHSRVNTTRSTVGLGSAASCLPPLPSPLITQCHNGQGLANTLGFVCRDTSQWSLQMGVELLRKQHLLWGS